MNIFKKIAAKFAAKKIEDALDLQEGTAMETKKWWKSKGVWTGVITVLIASYETSQKALAPQFGYNLPEIPSFIYMVLGSLGIYTRAVADTKVVK